MSENREQQYTQNLATSNITKVFTEVLVTRVKAKIKKVLLNTRGQLVQKHNIIEDSRLKILSQLKFLQGSQKKCSDLQCTRCHNFGTKKHKIKVQGLKQRLDDCQKKQQQIENNHDELLKISFAMDKNGLKQFQVLEQAKPSNFVEIKKQVLDVNDLYERGRLKLDKLNQIYTQFYNLSLHPCGICFVKQKINKIIILKCGHSLCDNCFDSLMKSKSIQNQFMKCPFCRQQIEFLADKQIENQ